MPVFLSPIYDSLDTNIPHTLMNFQGLPFPSGCPLFPPYQTVRQYLEDYATDVRHLLKLGTQVMDVVPVDLAGKWRVTTRVITTGSADEAVYDAVIVASGHYDDPYVPNIPGLSEWNETYPGSISHSKFYRRPEWYRDKVNIFLILHILVWPILSLKP